MTKAQLKRDYALMVEHLNQAVKKATEIREYLDPVQDPAPKRGTSKKKKELAKVAEIKAYIVAKHNKKFEKLRKQTTAS